MTNVLLDGKDFLFSHIHCLGVEELDFLQSCLIVCPHTLPLIYFVLIGMAEYCFVIDDYVFDTPLPSPVLLS